MNGKIVIYVGIPVLAIALFSVFGIDYEKLEIRAFQSDVKLVQSNTAISDEVTAEVIKKTEGRVFNIEIQDGVGTEESLGGN